MNVGSICQPQRTNLLKKLYNIPLQSRDATLSQWSTCLTPWLCIQYVGRIRETKFPYLSCWGIPPKISLNTLAYPVFHNLASALLVIFLNVLKVDRLLVVSHSQDLNTEELLNTEALPFMIRNKQGCPLNCAEVLTNLITKGNKRKVRLWGSN